jgi:hypothetical protein
MNRNQQAAMTRAAARRRLMALGFRPAGITGTMAAIEAPDTVRGEWTRRAPVERKERRKGGSKNATPSPE